MKKSYELRQDSYSRGIPGASSGGIAAFNVGWYFPDEFSRVLSHIGELLALQWKPEQHIDGGYIVSTRVRTGARKNLRVWLPDGADDKETWPEAGR